MKTNIINNLKIELNEHDFKSNEIYVTLGIKLGFSTKQILYKDTGKIEKINQSSSYVYSNYLKTLFYKKHKMLIRINTLRDGTYISFKTTSNKISDDLIKLFSTIYIDDLDEVLFEKAKLDTKNNFKEKYKDIHFKASFKIMEFSDINKDFLFDEFSKSIVDINYSDFNNFKKNIVIIENSFLFINGSLDNLKLNDFFNYLKCIPTSSLEFVQAVKSKDIYLKTDKHLILKDKVDFNVSCISFDFLNKEITPLSKQVLLSIINEILFLKDSQIVVDEFDSSIISFNSSLKEYKLILNDYITQDNVQNAKNKILNKIDYLIDTLPYSFNMLYVNFYINGIDLIDYIDVINSCDDNLIKEIINQGNIKITEGQLLYRK